MATKLYPRTDLRRGDDKEIPTFWRAPARLVYKDVFNLKYMYVMLHEWFVDNEFVGTREDQDFPEVMYVHRDFGVDKQLYWRWRFERESPNSKIFRWCLDMDVHILNLKQVETVVNGQKVKSDFAEVEVFIAPALYLKTSAWKDQFVLDMLLPILMNSVYRKRIQNEKRLFEQVMWQCQESLKTYFKLDTYLPERQGHEFHQKVDLTS